MNYIFYHITSASLSWNPFINFLHTIHSIPPPDIATGWHLLCLIYFSCTNKKWDLYIPDVITPTSRRVQLNSLRPCRVTFGLYHWPEGQWPFHPSSGSSIPLGLLDTSQVKDYLLNPRQHSIEHMANSAPVACTHPESRQMEPYYILYFKSPSYNIMKKNPPNTCPTDQKQSCGGRCWCVRVQLCSYKKLLFFFQSFLNTFFYFIMHKPLFLLWSKWGRIWHEQEL